jgi:hypothetical protein
MRLEELRADQESAEHEEEIDPGPTEALDSLEGAGDNPAEVKTHDREDGDGAQAVESRRPG